MRNVGIVLWCFVILVCVCTVNFQQLLDHGTVSFQLNRHPVLSDYLMVSDISLHSRIYVTQKIGHFSCFFILTLIATFGARSRAAFRRGFLFALGFAVFTELLQPFFGRDGRIVDMFIDSAGIVLAALIVRLSGSVKRDSRRNSRMYY
ncbi:VanZ family protein [Paenibacillus sp. PR3]|uniref:VanZ family protein n=1 Tax=Paenibacillus terricola TaxID=2763503 RepID=A0ABR8N1T0_9BACL|nr:VanZ family protein [Paenibacillus terricola]MBD3921165.1 VanZ family protein [Paenibacillus terricola]